MLRPDAPDWEVSKTVPKCPFCGVKFGVFIRKHHCRSCGRVVCDDCSDSRCALPQYGYYAAQRICDACVKDAKMVIKELGEDNITADFVSDQLIQHWIDIASDPAFKNELRQRAYFGVPHAIRGVIWATLTEASDVAVKNYGIYEQLFTIDNPEVKVQIEYDVPRTFPTHPAYSKEHSPEQDKLRRVLTAYSNFKEYSQNLSYIAAVLLMVTDEETSFWILVQMVKKYRLLFLFQHEVPDEIRNYSTYLETHLPDLYEHCEKHGLSIEIFAAQWLKTLFAQQFDLKLVYRLWDILCVDGFRFMLKVPLAILTLYKSSIMEAQGADLMFFLQGLPSKVRDIDAVIVAAAKIKLVGKSAPSSPESTSPAMERTDFGSSPSQNEPASNVNSNNVQ